MERASRPVSAAFSSGLRSEPERHVSTVGIIVNPNAGKDIRRLVTPATHTSDVTKVGIVRRAIVAAAESGAERILIAPDTHRLGRRAADGLDAPVEIVDEPVTGSRFDTIGAARRFWKEQVGAVIALGGDGTSRDVALGWPDAPLIAISTGTNNVYPVAVDGTSAGAAAGLVASGIVSVADVARRSKKIVVRVDDRDSSVDDVALVDLAFIDADFIGARAVRDPSTITAVVAAVATPASTGLSSIAGRIHPVDRWESGGVFVRLGAGGRRVRVPLAPGSFTTIDVAEVRPLAEGESITLSGRTILAFDGERDLAVSPDGTVTVRVESSGPLVIDVERTLVRAASALAFDHSEKDDHGH
ncbi:MAG: ATP-NAD kinase [Acidimicrobiales bacterium mtb01]|nr:ATP-NAD kinase [Actinomycetota bacterium]TEX45437.1 MAG: ATP-NAD kinase [Acidimicrobiales bacterium mtb01]